MLPLILLVTILLEIILVVVVYRNQSNRLINKLFSVFVLFGALWTFGVGIMLYSTDRSQVDIGVQMFLAMPVITSYFVLLFAHAFPDKLITRNYWLSTAAIPIILVILSLGWSDIFVSQVELNDVRNIITVNSLPYTFYALYFGIYLGLACAVLLKKSITHKYDKQVRDQARFLFAAIGFASIVSAATNLTLPILGESKYVWAGPLSTLAFSILIGFSIIRHKLFDIRFVVARSVAYLFSWALLAAAYVIILVNTASYLFDTELSVNVELFVYVFLGVTLATGLVPLKRKFDRLSNKIFYRDAYDPQEFLDGLNKVFVSNVDLVPLLENTSKVIGENLKNGFTSFYVRKTQYIETRVLGDAISGFDEDDFERISQLVSHVHQSVIVLDYLEDNEELKELMKQYDIAVIARLVTTIEYDLEGVGFLALGPKKSGSPYTRQDMKMIEIIANELVIAIQNALRFEEIEEFNATLQQKVDDATKKLRKTNEKLKEMDETKDEFISMASHQLRTPLTSVKGYLSMVLEGDAGDIKPMQEKLLSQAFTSSQRMVYLIADLLNVSRLRTGKFVIEKIRANLADVVQGEVDQLKETAFSRDLKLTYEKPDNFPELMIDETKVRQVIMNFIDNAIYYTPSGGSITVKLEDKKDSVEYTVTDTGMGVPKQDQQHLFTKFYRAGNARKARPDGTGLGLFMAKKVIIAQEGAVIFKSKEGEGSTFGFTFPKRALMPPEKSKKVDI